MKLRKAGIVTLSAVIPACLYADSGPEGNGVMQQEVKSLERTIKTTKIKNWVIKRRNEELNSRKKELESRIANIRRSLQQEDAVTEE